MTDRELLELAAKAAGLAVEWDYYVGGEDGGFVTREGFVWQPLTDDGDALRLAVKLKMDVLITEVDVWAMAEADPAAGCSEFAAPDPHAATRRAIVRAAAEIGKNK